MATKKTLAMHKLYRGGMTMKEVGAAQDPPIKTPAVSLAFKRAGLPVRTPWETMRLNGTAPKPKPKPKRPTTNRGGFHWYHNLQAHCARLRRAEFLRLNEEEGMSLAKIGAAQDPPISTRAVYYQIERARADRRFNNERDT